MGKKKEEKKARKKEEKALRKEEKAKKKEDKRLRQAKKEAKLEERERALLKRASKPARKRKPPKAEPTMAAPTMAEPTTAKPIKAKAAKATPMKARPKKARPTKTKTAPAEPAPRPTRAASPRPLRQAAEGGRPTRPARKRSAPRAPVAPEAAEQREITQVIHAPADREPPDVEAGGGRGPQRMFDDVALDEAAAEHDSPEEIEARMNGFLRASLGARAGELLGDGSDEPVEPKASSVLGSARDLLSSDTYLRALGNLRMRGRSIEVDEYGLDPKIEARWQPFFDFLYGTYWRVQVKGVENIPDAGRCLLVANHSGTVPYDGAMIKTAVAREHAARRAVRWLAEDFVFHFPFVGVFMNQIGAVRACQENAERMLLQERLVAVFPEGVKGIGKLYKERYKLQRFGRGGYVKLVLRTGAPIIPVAVVGAEEIHPLLLRGRTLANMIGMPYIPVTPTFPWLGPLGLVPLPSQWRIEFGAPIAFEGHGPEDAEDPILVNRLNDQVRGRIQDMVDRLLMERDGPSTASPDAAQHSS